MRNNYKILVIQLIGLFCFGTLQANPKQVKISNQVLLDKIKGAWAGQTIGVTYGGETEFKYKGTMIQDYIDIEWNDTIIEHNVLHNIGLYDDIYVDMTFSDVIENCGIEAPIDSFANRFARSQFPLWAANQQARYNLLQGIKAPQSGYWTNNPFADGLDFQIEADFAGIMSPGMPNSAVAMCDKVGRIMCSGDGLYSGMYLATLYSLAYTSNNMEKIVKEGLMVIPEGSELKKALTDVINWHKKYPKDWKQCWFEVERKWSEDKCIVGAFGPLNVEALNNCCYIVIGLLYGDGDFYKTMDIATRCGQDSDCNPSNAGGILGAMIGYNAIPERWKTPLSKAEKIKIEYCGFSLDSVYKSSFKHAATQIVKNGGKQLPDGYLINKQRINTKSTLEKNFENHFVQRMPKLGVNLVDSIIINQYSFNGIVISGGIDEKNMTPETKNYVAEVDVFIDHKWIEKINLPASFNSRNPVFYYKYNLEDKMHSLKFVWRNFRKGISIQLNNALIYSNKSKSTNQYVSIN